MPEDVKEKIIFSAIDLFAEKGFHETKVDEIAERSGVAKGTMYLYFKSKEELLEKSIEFVLDRAIENYNIDENKGFYENLKGIIVRNAEFVKNNINFYKVIFSSVYRVRSGESFEKRKCDINKILSYISRLLEKGRSEGIVRNDIHISNLSTLLTNLIFSSMMNIVIMLVFNKDFSDEYIDKFVEDIFKFAISGVKEV